MTKPPSTATQRALLCLYDGGWNGITAGEVGGSVWPDRACRSGRGVSSNGGGDYAAQMLLGRLKKAGLVEYAPSEGSTRWRLSTKGRDKIRALSGPHDVPATKPAKGTTPRGKSGGGAIVRGTDPCTCGCAPEAHGRDPEYPGSTSCTECDDCIAYEADPEAA